MTIIFKRDFSNPQVKYSHSSQLAPFIVVITNYDNDIYFAKNRQPCPERRFV